MALINEGLAKERLPFIFGLFRFAIWPFALSLQKGRGGQGSQLFFF